MLKIGVIGTSKKQNERRVPIHPDQVLGRIDLSTSPNLSVQL